MRFYWIKDRVAQGHFVVHWRRGADNLADYFTKHHSPAHHRLMRSRYLLSLHRPTLSVHGGEGVLIRSPGSQDTSNGPDNRSDISSAPTDVTSAPTDTTSDAGRILAIGHQNSSTASPKADSSSDEIGDACQDPETHQSTT
jgi:hypothetical protein